MADNKGSGSPAVTDEMRKEYYEAAERQYGSMTREEASLEWAKLNRGPTVWDWFKDRVRSFVNFVKVATMSVFLGRAATERRLAADMKQQRIDNLMAEAQKTAKLQVLKERMGVPEAEKAAEVREEKTSDKEEKEIKSNPEPEKDKQVQEKETEKDLNKERDKDREKEIVKQEEAQAKEPKQAENPEREENAAEKGAEETKSSPEQADKSEAEPVKTQETPETDKKNEMGSKTIFAEQVESLTDKYKQGLLEFLEKQTGISRDYINISNYKGDFVRNGDDFTYRSNGDAIRVTFNLDPDLKTDYQKGVTINARGIDMENTPVSKALASSILYYTANVYREAKNNTRFPGTVPTKDMVANFMNICFKQSRDDSREEKNETKQSTYMFGHQIDFYRHGEEIKFSIDQKEIALKPGISPRDSVFESLSDVIRDKEFGDYSRDNLEWLSGELHKESMEKIPNEYYVKYTREDLTKWLSKELNDFARTGAGDEKNIYFHGHEITMRLNDDKQVSSVSLDGETVYDNSRGQLDNVKIAQYTAFPLVDALDKDHMYEPGELEAAQEHVVSQLDENGHLIGYDNDWGRPDHGMTFEENIEYAIEAGDVAQER